MKKEVVEALIKFLKLNYHLRANPKKKKFKVGDKVEVNIGKGSVKLVGEIVGINTDHNENYPYRINKISKIEGEGNLSPHLDEEGYLWVSVSELKTFSNKEREGNGKD